MEGAVVWIALLQMYFTHSMEGAVAWIALLQMYFSSLIHKS